MESRCVGRRPVRYDWYGDEVPADSGISAESRVAHWFAVKTANDLLRDGRLKSTHFNDVVTQLEGFVWNKLDRASQGRLTPGTEVQAVYAAVRENLAMFEFRMHFRSGLLDTDGRKLLIRHYDDEPPELPGNVYGVHMHVKDVSGGRDEDIHASQDEQIAYAIGKCRDGARHHWVNPSER